MVCLVCVVQRQIMMMSDCSGEQKHYVTGWLQVVIDGCFWGKHHQLNGFYVVKRQVNYCDYKQYSGWIR